MHHANFSELLKKGKDLLEKEMSLIDSTAKGPLSIKSINMQYFNNYGKGPNKIEFEDELYVIKGPTGSGKSSILDAITFALFKRSSRKDVGLNIDQILYPIPRGLEKSGRTRKFMTVAPFLISCASEDTALTTDLAR